MDKVYVLSACLEYISQEQALIAYIIKPSAVWAMLHLRDNNG